MFDFTFNFPINDVFIENIHTFLKRIFTSKRIMILLNNQFLIYCIAVKFLQN